MRKTATITLGVVMCAILFFCACKNGKPSGEYAVVVPEESLAAITNVPPASTMSLPEYRAHIKTNYSGKTLKFTSEDPHSFVFPVKLDGSVEGLIRGGWKLNETNRSEVLIYQWVSGSMYWLWGRATPTNGGFRVQVDGFGEDFTLYLK